MKLGEAVPVILFPLKLFWIETIIQSFQMPE